MHRCTKNSVSRFLNIEPKKEYDSLVKKLGNPEVVINKPGGFVMWFPKKMDPSNPYTCIILKDEQVLHKITDKDSHYDFLYTTIVINIPENKLSSVLSINKSIFYDRVTRELTVRCSTLESNKTIVYKIVQYLLNKPVDSSIDIEDKYILDSLNTINSSYRESFNPKQYRQIPVAP